MNRLKAMAVSAVLSSAAAVSLQAQAQPDTIRAALRYTQADVDFLSMMIAHHAQAIAMCHWAPTHGASESVQTLCGRVINAQGDEIVIFQNWLRDHHQPVPTPDPRGYHMAGMSQPMLMPGMLTPAQMAQLDSARGQDWDRLFLRDMIMHHRGAVDMVNHLFAQGAGEEESVYKYAADIYGDQTTEIDRMQRMLLASYNAPQGQ